MSDERYPIGKFTPPTTYTPASRAEAIAHIAEAPSRVRESVNGLSAVQLQTPYRDGGWTVAQVVHHLADSHLLAYMRFKWTLTEEEPALKGYDQVSWAALPDAADSDIDASLDLVDALHRRWVGTLRRMTGEQFSRKFIHHVQGLMPLDRILALYAWHGRHHVAHIQSVRARHGW